MLIKIILGVIRAPFLLLVPAVLAPAFALSYRHSGQINGMDALLVTIAALGAHIGVNALNEYQDFTSGLDATTPRTPFSGGSGTLILHPEAAQLTLWVTILSLLITAAIGLYFAPRFGWELITLGLLGMAIIVSYTRCINRFPLLCLLAPGAGFGLLMVNLSTLVLSGEISEASIWVSITVTLLVSNLLLVNQLPDIDADRASGRNHLAIAWGARTAIRVSPILLAGCYVALLLGWMLNQLPAGALFGCLTAPLAIAVAIGVSRFDPQQPELLIPAMGKNVVVTLTTPFLAGIGLFIFS